MAKKQDTNQEVQFLEYHLRWLRYTIAKRTLAYKPHDKFTYSQPQGDYKPLLTLELAPSYKNLPNASTNTAFAITDELQLIAWNTDTGMVHPHLTHDLPTFAHGVYLALKNIYLSNLEYATEVLHTFFSSDESENVFPYIKPKIIRMQEATKPNPISSWKASAKAFLNYVTHGFLEQTSQLNISHYVKEPTNEDFNLLYLDDTTEEIFQIGETILQVSDTEHQYHLGRFRLKQHDLKVQTRDNLQWSHLTTLSSNKPSSQNVLVMLSLASALNKLFKLVEDTQQEWFNSPTEELKQIYGIDYFQVVWKFR